MDTRVETAPQAPAIRHQLRFEGSGGEYFKIWIVNLALTIVTLGIFSAWAKVRNKRYFYGNTYIGEHNFDYHGSPLRILLGRLIALALLLGYSATVHFLPGLTFVWGFCLPVRRALAGGAGLRFNARNSSYRNIRFNFTGTLWRRLWRLYSLGRSWPRSPCSRPIRLARRARDQYNINNHSFGGKYFHAKIPGAAMYRIYLMALLFFLGFAAVASGYLFDDQDRATRFSQSRRVGAVLSGVRRRLSVQPAVPDDLYRHQRLQSGPRSTVLAERFRFEATLSPLHMTWLMFSNLVLTLRPWACSIHGP